VRKIGIVTEGESEVRALPKLYPALQDRTGVQLINPLRAAVDPLAPIAVLTAGLSTSVRLSFARGAHAVIVILDRENAEVTAAVRALELEENLQAKIDENIRVVIKDKCFENWLIASPEAFHAQKARYAHPDRIAAKVLPNRADAVGNACALINSAISKGQYDKTNDAPKILSHSKLESLAANSRSFRRFLAVLGDPAYKNGSRTP
jgi:Domain of unknown function (DUF4276)